MLESEIREAFEGIGNMSFQRYPSGKYKDPQRQFAWEFFKHGVDFKSKKPKKNLQTDQKLNEQIEYWISCLKSPGSIRNDDPVYEVMRERTIDYFEKLLDKIDAFNELKACQTGYSIFDPEENSLVEINFNGGLVAKTKRDAMSKWPQGIWQDIKKRRKWKAIKVKIVPIPQNTVSLLGWVD